MSLYSTACTGVDHEFEPGLLAGALCNRPHPTKIVRIFFNIGPKKMIERCGGFAGDGVHLSGAVRVRTVVLEGEPCTCTGSTDPLLSTRTIKEQDLCLRES